MSNDVWSVNNERTPVQRAFPIETLLKHFIGVSEDLWRHLAKKNLIFFSNQLKYNKNRLTISTFRHCKAKRRKVYFLPCDCSKFWVFTHKFGKFEFFEQN